MKTVKAKANQTVYDIALEHYGNVEAVAGIMANNPGLMNDPAVLAALGIDVLADDGFYADAALRTGEAVRIDTESPLMRPAVLKELTGEEITTFNIK